MLFRQRRRHRRYTAQASHRRNADKSVVPLTAPQANQNPEHRPVSGPHGHAESIRVPHLREAQVEAWTAICPVS